MLYEVSQANEDSWQVRMLDSSEVPLVAHFSGLDARQAANEYAAWKEGENWITVFHTVLYSLQTP